MDSLTRASSAISGAFASGHLAMASATRSRLVSAEFLLAHQATVLSTNYLIRPGDVWVRRGELVKPVSADPDAGLPTPAGLSGASQTHGERHASTASNRLPSTTSGRPGGRFDILDGLAWLF